MSAEDGSFTLRRKQGNLSLLDNKRDVRVNVSPSIACVAPSFNGCAFFFEILQSSVLVDVVIVDDIS
jgi:hypothetical protein